MSLPKPVELCTMCLKHVKPGEGLRNTHALVCSMLCAGVYNATHGTHYAFGPNR